MLLIRFYHLQCSFYHIYVVNYDIVFIFFLLGIRTIVNLWSRNKFIIIIIIIINIKVYNFLMRLNETRNVLWHESRKCVCLLNSSVCNSKQIWNSDTCRCDCNEDFAGIINCTKGYMWNPSTCACECDMWCKSNQYLDHKNCVCKNKVIGRVIAECTSIINETMINNKADITNDDTTKNIFFGLFSVLMLAGIACFCIFAYSKWIKGKKII